MNDLEVIQVIKTRLLRLGDGRSEDNPVRIIEQYWDMHGNLLWQIDPFTPENPSEECPP